MNGIVDTLKVLFAARGIESPHDGVWMISDPEGPCLILQCCSRMKGRAFAAEFVTFSLDGQPGLLEQPIVAPASLRMAQRSLQVGACNIVALLTELDVAIMLVKASDGPWEYRSTETDDSECSLLHEQYVVSFGDIIDLAELRHQNAERARAGKAMRLLKQAQRPWQNKRPVSYTHLTLPTKRIV